MSDCPNLEKCGFVKKYGKSKALAVKGFVTIYCKNEKQNLSQLTNQTYHKKISIDVYH